MINLSYDTENNLCHMLVIQLMAVSFVHTTMLLLPVSIMCHMQVMCSYLNAT